MDLVLGLLGLGVYLLPGIIASSRKNKNEQSIWLWNIFGGWCGIVWIVCLINAISGEKEKE